MKHILKYQLLILILCLAAVSSQSKALVISSDKTLVAKNDSLVNLSSAQGIEKIWLEDCRPDSNVVILSWNGSDLPDTINCRIQRWEKKEGPINFKNFYLCASSRKKYQPNIY